jgi:hypothetical protein
MTWKALFFVLLFNALLSIALTGPIASAVHTALDHSPFADRFTQSLPGAEATFYAHFTRRHPDVLGDTGKWDDLVSGEPVTSGLFSMSGASGSLLLLGLLNAIAAAVFSGGFAGRFGADRDRGSLSAFGADCGRFAFSSLVLGAVSLFVIGAAYRWVFAATGTLYAAESLRYEWESVALTLLRLGAFLLVAGFVRLIVLYARAAIGISRNGNPFLALLSGAGFVAGRPKRTLALELCFGVTGLAPLVLWGLYTPAWNGDDPASLAVFIVAEELLVLFRIATRMAHLGAASSFMRRAAEAARPAPEKLERAPGAVVVGPAA